MDVNLQEIAIDHHLANIKAELLRALNKFPSPFKSSHEAYAVIKEELDEFWDEVRKDGSEDRKIAEASQIAAMALRYMVQPC